MTTDTINGFPMDRRGFLSIVSAGILGFGGCGSANESSSVTVYTALDREFSEPILQRFTRQTGIHVAAKYDLESTKTVGLVEAIIAERERPRCDLFWNNELLNTLRLQNLGLLREVPSPAAGSFPAKQQDPRGAWYGFAGRLRVILVNVNKVAESDLPRSVRELISPRWRGRCGWAKPLFGTTATQAAVWWASWGAEKMTQFLSDLHANKVQILGGNKQVAAAVAAGSLDWGLTDTDDALGRVAAGDPVKIVYPDQIEDGALLIPNTLCLIKDSPHAAAAVQLRDWLLSAEVESELCAGPSGQIPLHRDGVTQQRLRPLAELRIAEIDWHAAADAWPTAMRALREYSQ